ncbi:hypothetical protein K466DRAFT_655387 [Polyporus arcularius HHB13444]|uniref:Nitrogen regulatory protein areA GATA-like domain-containing protein n=1 Tax=Polyporus arcularius HHB13444 TaxID=1314778 RepID=A0A5C3PBB6_9APHY|nr:hypothetical protein K466DRAFT_655387 [Polyporus arcularius HHB13444]
MTHPPVNIPGPAASTARSYFPLLLVSVPHGTSLDDSCIGLQAENSVDYLSHNWRDEDMWRSWRSMTRQKNIHNGLRLQNASWRAWWKLMNGLKTVDPELINWIKDSDVTWLHGPLHIGHDWNHYSQRKTQILLHREASIVALPGPHDTSTTPSYAPRKSILKSRRMKQFLAIPANPSVQAAANRAAYDSRTSACLHGPPRTLATTLSTISSTRRDA